MPLPSLSSFLPTVFSGFSGMLAGYVMEVMAKQHTGRDKALYSLAYLLTACVVALVTEHVLYSYTLNARVYSIAGLWGALALLLCLLRLIQNQSKRLYFPVRLLFVAAVAFSAANFTGPSRGILFLLSPAAKSITIYSATGSPRVLAGARVIPVDKELFDAIAFVSIECDNSITPIKKNVIDIQHRRTDHGNGSYVSFEDVCP